MLIIYKTHLILCNKTNTISKLKKMTNTLFNYHFEQKTWHTILTVGIEKMPLYSCLKCTYTCSSFTYWCIFFVLNVRICPAVTNGYMHIDEVTLQSVVCVCACACVCVSAVCHKSPFTFACVLVFTESINIIIMNLLTNSLQVFGINRVAF